MSGTATRLGKVCAGISRYITESYDPALAPETVLWRRVTKVCEESGEVWQALAGMVGENPRKGVTHSQEDLIGELLDVALAALGAVEHLVGDDGSSAARLDAKADTVLGRLGLVTA